jgi:glycosyltransferase involved in cell wall biosynthesis
MIHLTSNKIPRLVFAHDGRFVRRDDRVYTMGSFPAVVWRRYLEIASEVQVVARDATRARDAECAVALSDMAGVQFELQSGFHHQVPFFSSYSSANRTLRRLIIECDAVIVRLPSAMGMLAVQMARELGKPYAIEVVACVWDSLWNHGRIAGKVLAPFAFIKTRQVVGIGTHVIYVTQNFLQHRYPCKGGVTEVCSNVEIAGHSRAVLEERINRIKSVGDPTLALGLIGSLRTRYKGIQTVMQALSVARDRLPPVQFHVLGGGDAGPWRKEAQEHGVADLVCFDGTRASGPDVCKWLDAIDVYLQPSLQEGLPRALVEAMSRGCPAIGSRRAGIPELLDDDCLIAPGDHRALAEKILHACGSKEWRFQKAERNWIKAGEYTKELLDARRTAFWRRFADDVLAQKKPAYGAPSQESTGASKRAL